MDVNTMLNVLLNGDLTVVIELIIAIVFLIIGRYLIPVIKQKLTKEQQSTLSYWLEVAVNAAEEAGRTGKIPKSEKMQYAINVLNQNGIKYDETAIEALIDSKVRELINQFKEDEIEMTTK